MKTKYEVSVIVKVHRQISVEANNLQEAIDTAREQTLSDFGGGITDIEIVEVQEDFVAKDEV